MSRYISKKEYTELDFVFDVVRLIGQKLDKYDKYIRYVWKSVVVPFVNSPDCELCIDSTSFENEKEFAKMMKDIPYYKQLQVSHRNYNKRLAQLQADMDDNLDIY